MANTLHIGGGGSITDADLVSAITDELIAAGFSQGGGGGAKVYRALLTYSGGNVVVEELENGLSGTPTWTRSAQGVYLCTLTGEFSDTRTFCQATGQGDYIDASNGCLFTFYRQDVDTCILTANGIDVNDSSHGLFDISSTLPTSVEIIVYP